MATGVLDLFITHNPMAFLFDMCKPSVVVDDKEYVLTWGEHRLEVEPGEHNLKIFFRYMWMAECGANTIQVNVAAGDICRVKYYMPSWVYAKGKMTIQ